MSKLTASLFIGLFAVLSGCATISADDHAAHQSVGAATDASAMSMQGMQQNMQQMREQMSKIHATKDPAERKRLMGEHQQSMQSQMKMMHGMMGADGSHQMGGQMMDGKGQGKDDMMQHHQTMMGRMDMMQSMMEQMMEHMAAEHQNAPSDAKKKP
jgi:hypothetical protein